MTIKKCPLTALPTDPNSRFVPTPMEAVKRLSPAQFSPFLTLNVVTSRRNDNRPARTSRAPTASLQKWSGNWAGGRRSDDLAPMRRDHFQHHLDGMVEAEVLKSYSLDGKRGNTLAWSWPPSDRYQQEGPGDLRINTGLRGRGNHSTVPKAIAYDPRPSGAAKKVMTGIHFMRYVRRPYSKGPALPWTAELEQGMEDLGKYIGMKRTAVSNALEECEHLDLLELDIAPRMLTRIRIMPITANYVLVRTPKGARKEMAHWMPLSLAYPRWGAEEAQARVRYYREFGEVYWEDAQYWAVQVRSGSPLLRMDEDLREGYDYGNKGPVEGTRGGDQDFDDDEEDYADVVQQAVGRIEVKPSPIEMLGLEFDRRVQAIDDRLGRGRGEEPVPAAHERVTRKAHEWIGSGSSRKEILAVMDLFFANPGVAELLQEGREYFCGVCYARPGRQCQPQCSDSLAGMFFKMAPDLSDEVAKQPVEEVQTEPVAEEPVTEVGPEEVEEPEPEVEVEPEADLTSAEGLVEEFQRRARAILPGMSSMAPRYMKREANNWLDHQTPEEILAVMELFLAGPAHDLPSHAHLGRCFAAQYPDLLPQLVEQTTEEWKTA